MSAYRYATQLVGSGVETVFHLGDLQVDLSGRSVLIGGEKIQLTPRLLTVLIRHAGKVLTHR